MEGGLATQLHGGTGDGDLRAELLRLRIGPPRQCPAGDAGGKSEIVLDFRAGAGLSAWRFGLEHEHVQAFGRAVDCGPKAGWSGAHDDEIADRCRVEKLVEAEALRDLLVARVLQDARVAADD